MCFNFFLKVQGNVSLLLFPFLWELLNLCWIHCAYYSYLNRACHLLKIIQGWGRERKRALTNVVVSQFFFTKPLLQEHASPYRKHISQVGGGVTQNKAFSRLHFFYLETQLILVSECKAYYYFLNYILISLSSTFSLLGVQIQRIEIFSQVLVEKYEHYMHLKITMQLSYNIFLTFSPNLWYLQIIYLFSLIRY